MKVRFLFAFAAMAACASSPVRAGLVVHDAFQSTADRMRGELSADRANWYVLNPNSGYLATTAGGSGGSALTVVPPADYTSSIAYMARWNPVTLAVGQTLTVSVTLSFDGLPPSQGFRIGVFDGTPNGVVTADLSSLKNATFSGDPGYCWAADSSLAIGSAPIVSSLFTLGERTTLTSGNVFSSGADFTRLQTGNGRNKAWTSGTRYTLTMTFTLAAANDLRINAKIAGGAFGAGVASTEAVDTSPSTTTFEYLLLRQANANALRSVTFHELDVAVTPAVAK